MTEFAVGPMLLSEVLDGAFGVYRRSFGALLAVALIGIGVPGLLRIAVVAGGGSRLHPAISMVTTLLFYILAPIVEAGAVWIVAESVRGGDPLVRTAFRATLPIAPILVLVLFVRLLLLVAGLLAFIVPGVFVIAGLCVVCQVLVLERGRSKGFAAFSRSWRLTRGFRAKAFAVFAVFAVFLWVPYLGMLYLVRILPTLETSILAVYYVAEILLLPIAWAALTLLYLDLRARKEGFDLAELEAALGPAPIGA